MTRRAEESWGSPSERVVVTLGGAVTRRLEGTETAGRNNLAADFASAPFKGLREAIDVLGPVRGEYPALRLEVYGSARLHGDAGGAGRPPPRVNVRRVFRSGRSRRACGKTA